MRLSFPDPDHPIGPEWWAPLLAVVDFVQGIRRHRLLAVEDFMLMGRVLRRARPDIALYKHCFTRRYLNLDDDGRAYRYSVPRSDPLAPGRYLAHRSLDDALGNLGLWELPWMKPGLEHERAGLGVHERWAYDLDLRPDVVEPLGPLPVPCPPGDGQLRTGGMDRRHLRVV